MPKKYRKQTLILIKDYIKTVDNYKRIKKYIGNNLSNCNNMLFST
jgi:hypothetical protein